MDTWLQVALTSASAIVSSIIASSGFWAYRQRKGETKSSMAIIVMGMAYREITTRGPELIERGYVTKDELEELVNFFYEPYKALGGNGVAEQIMNRVKQLPITTNSRFAGILPRNEGFVNNVRVIPAHPGQNAAPE